MVVFIPLYVQLIKIIAVIVVVILLIIGVFVFIIPLFKPKDAAAYAKKNEYTDCVEKKKEKECGEIGYGTEGKSRKLIRDNNWFTGWLCCKK